MRIPNKEKPFLLAIITKKKKKRKIVKLANGATLPYNDYKKLKVKWDEMQILEQMPVIVGKPRMTELETIVHYLIIESQVLKIH